MNLSLTCTVWGYWDGSAYIVCGLCKNVAFVRDAPCDSECSLVYIAEARTFMLICHCGQDCIIWQSVGEIVALHDINSNDKPNQK